MTSRVKYKEDEDDERGLIHAVVTRVKARASLHA